ncbi:MAG: T9SS type A sorting domain-containing protein [Paludibacter sp.]|nr:T9SS type A sorting domain-containing protein [Paludibacter sp.]
MEPKRPVSKKEINRNEAVYELQGNRNPFIDYPVLSEYVWGEYTDETWSGDNATPEEEPDFYVHYDFSSKILFAKILYPESSVYKIYNLSGIIISEGSFSSDATINLSDLSKGMYIIVIYSNKHRKTAKILI